MSHKRAITEADVRAVLPAATLEVPTDAVVTPAARDLARKLGVAIIAVHAPPPDHKPAAAPPAPKAEAPAPPPPPPPPAPAPQPKPQPQRAAKPAPPPEPAPKPAAKPEPAPPPSGGGRVVALGADHGGFPMKELLKPLLGELGFAVADVGTASAAAVDYPDFAIAVARKVAQGEAWRGIMVDGAGIGSAMAANKIAGVRAALCYDVTTAANAREHNDANVLTLGGTLIGQRLAAEIVKTFLATEFGGGRHQKRVDKINLLDR